MLSPSLSANALCQQPLTLVYTGDWPPYFFRVNDSTYSGTDKDLLKSTLAKMDCGLEILPLPEKRVEMALRSGQADVVIAASKNPERQQQFWFSAPYRQQHNVLVYRTDGVLPENQGSVRSWLEHGRLIALNGGGWFGKEIEQLKHSRLGVSLLHVESFGSRLDMLRLGRVDGFIDDSLAVQARIREENLTDLRILERPVHVTPQHFMFSRARLDAKFIKTFNQSLRTLKEQAKR